MSHLEISIEIFIKIKIHIFLEKVFFS